ncbi:unnamed protein product, partial [Laminaria digitata]
LTSAATVQARLQAESALAEAQARESELMFEVDKLRSAKRALEVKAKETAAAASRVGIDAEGVLRQGEEVKRLDELLSQERAERAEEKRAARSKLDWYSENQELVDGQLEAMRAQEQELDRLRQALSKGAASG